MTHEEEPYLRPIPKNFTLIDHLRILEEYRQLRMPPEWLNELKEDVPFRPGEYGQLEGYSVSYVIDESGKFPVFRYTQLNLNQFKSYTPGTACVIDRSSPVEKIYFSGKITKPPSGYHITLVRTVEITRRNTAAGFFTPLDSV